MKKIILSMMLAVVALTAAAELREDAFIIRTTDGGAQGLLFGDVLKITFSNLDDDGVPHSGVYYQELHYPDTIIRTPVTEITSVTFDKPSVKYRSDVVVGTETGLFDYLTARDGYVLTFDGATPQSLLPAKGAMLTYLAADNAILGGVFAGRVLSVDNTAAGIVIATEQPDRIQDIYEELIGVEAIGNDSPGVQDCLRKAGALPKDDGRMRVDGKGEDSIDFDVPLGYTWDDNESNPDDPWMGDDGTNQTKGFSINGGIKGSIALRLIYEFSDTRDYLCVTSEYEYTPYFKLEFSAEKSWTHPFWDPCSLPVINIVVASCPVFQVRFGVAPFIKLSGSAKVSLEKTFATTKTRTMAIYESGLYRSSKCDNNDKGVDNDGGYELSLTLEGSAHVGLNMGLMISTTEVLKTCIGIIAEAYVGPKLTGSIGIVPSMQEGDGPNTVAWNAMKNWNISATWCAIDLSLSFYSKWLGGSPEKTTFSSMSFAINPFTVPLLPTFEAPNWSLADKYSFQDWWVASDINAPTTVTMGRPTGTSLLPIKPGYAVYDEDGKFLRSDYHSGKYYFMFCENDPEFDDMQWEFFDWLPNKKYKLYPTFKFPSSDGSPSATEFRAEPARTVEIPAQVSTGSMSIYDATYVTLNGTVDDEIYMCPQFEEVGFIVGRDKSTLKEEGERHWVTRWHHERDYDLGISLVPSTHYYYCAAAKVGNEYICGEVKEFTTGKKTIIYTGVDLGLPSGNIWCTTDVSTADYNGNENFYTWNSWENHPVYQEMKAQGWRMPTAEDFAELYNPEACRQDISGNSTTARFYPLGGGEGISFCGGLPSGLGGGASFYWSCTPEDIDYTDENGNVTNSEHNARGLWAQYGLHHTKSVDRTISHEGETHSGGPVGYYIKMVK